MITLNCRMKFAFLILTLLASENFIYSQNLNPSAWPHLKGYWKFQDTANLTKATVGNNLILNGIHQWVPGPDYGDTAVRTAIGSYYKSYHGMAPNGGGDSVNRYTLMFDFKVLNLDRWHTFFQTDTTNTNDGECFIRPLSSTTPGAIGVGYTGYSSYAVTPGKWNRLVISVNLPYFYKYYINGNLIHDGDTDDLVLDGRFALTPAILFFADNNQEDDTIDIASLAIFDTCLTDAQVAAVGTIDPCVLNPVIAKLGNDTSFCQGGSVVLHAPSGMSKYYWSGVQGNQTYTVNSGKSVVLKVVDSRGCESVPDTINITVWSRPLVNLGPDTVFCMGKSKFLNAGSGYKSYLWSDNYSGQTRTVTTTDTLWAKVQESAHDCWSLPDTIKIKVNPLPKVSLGNDTAICQGSSIIFDAGPNFKSYQWSGGTTTRTKTVNTTGTVSVYVIDYNNCQSITDTVMVTVHVRPQLSFGNDTSLCRGDSLQLDAGSGFKAYFWSNGFTGQKQTFYNTINLTARVQDSLTGCWSQDENIKITVHELPVKSLGADREFCEGTYVILDIGSYFNTFIWSNGFKGKTMNVYTSDTISLTVQDPVTKCWSNADTVILTMLPAPVISLGRDSSLCNGDTILLDPGSGFKSYLWSDGKTYSSRVVTTTKIFWVKVQDSNNCWSLPDTILITFNAPPHINLSTDTAFCEGGKIIIDAGAFASWNWSDGFNQRIREIDSSVLLTVSVLDFNHCQSNTDTIKVNVLPAPIPELGPDTNIALTDTLFLNPGQGFASYLWSDGSDSSVLKLIGAQKGTGTYYIWVKVTADNGCSGSDTVKVRVYDPIGTGMDRSVYLKIYPNPTAEKLVLELDRITESPLEISLFDNKGRLVMHKSFYQPSACFDLDMSHIQSGLYYLKVTGKGFENVFSILKK